MNVNLYSVTEHLKFAVKYSQATTLMLKWIDTELPENISYQFDAVICVARVRDNYGNFESFQAWVQLLRRLPEAPGKEYVIEFSTTGFYNTKAEALDELIDLIVKDCKQHMWAQSAMKELTQKRNFVNLTQEGEKG